MMDTADRTRHIDALLPQTQCRQCGYAGCRPYAGAIASGRADINQCPPGGDEGARELARAIGVPAKPVDPRFGTYKPPALALIDEATCIGCTLCIQACPVDAIVGAAKLMHTVIAADCTGCELCLPPCPVDCIRMVPGHSLPDLAARGQAADRSRVRYERREARLQSKRSTARTGSTHESDVKQRTLQRALTRAQQRLAQRKFSGGQ